MSDINKNSKARKSKKLPEKASRKNSSGPRGDYVSNLNVLTNLSSSFDQYRNISSLINPYRDLIAKIEQLNSVCTMLPEIQRATQLQREIERQKGIFDSALQLNKISQLPERFAILNASTSFLSTDPVSESHFFEMLDAVRMSDKLQSVVNNSIFLDSSLSASIQQIEQMNMYASLLAPEKIQIYTRLLPDILQAMQPLRDLYDKIGSFSMQINEIEDYVAVREQESEEESPYAEEFKKDLNTLPVHLEVKAAVFEQLYYDFRDEANATIDDLRNALAYVREENAYLRDQAGFLMEEVKMLQRLLEELDVYEPRG